MRRFEPKTTFHYIIISTNPLRRCARSLLLTNRRLQVMLLTWLLYLAASEAIKCVISLVQTMRLLRLHRHDMGSLRNLPRD